MTWESVVSTLLNLHWPNMPRLVAQWEWPALVVLLVALGLLVLWEDWRISLLAWSAVGVSVTVLLVRVLPVPWALSRMLAAGLDGSLLWFGARRWPRARLRPGAGLWLRLPVMAVALLAGWQAQPYLHAAWPDAPRADAALALGAAGILLMVLKGDVLHGTVGLLLWLNAAVLALAAYPIPTDWFLAITLLDVVLAAAGSFGVASAGEAAAQFLRERNP